MLIMNYLRIHCFIKICVLQKIYTFSQIYKFFIEKLTHSLYIEIVYYGEGR